MTVTVDMQKSVLFCCQCHSPCGKLNFVFCASKKCLEKERFNSVFCLDCKYSLRSIDKCQSCDEDFAPVQTFKMKMIEYNQLEELVKHSKRYHFAPFLEMDFKCEHCQKDKKLSELYMCSTSCGAPHCSLCIINNGACNNQPLARKIKALFSGIDTVCQFCNRPAAYRCGGKEDCRKAKRGVCGDCCWIKHSCGCGKSLESVRDLINGPRKQITRECNGCQRRVPLEDLFWVQDHNPDTRCKNYKIPKSGSRYHQLRQHFKLIDSLNEMKTIKDKYHSAIIKDLL